MFSVRALAGADLVRQAVAATSGPKDAGKVSVFGPAFLLGGSADAFTAGVYDAAARRAAQRSGAVRRGLARKRQRLIHEAVRQINRGNFGAARTIASRLLKRDVNDVAALRLAGKSYLREQQYDLAQRFFARAAALAPHSEAAQRDLRDARLLARSDAEVLKVARQKLASRATRSDAMRLLGHLARRSPDNAEVFTLLGQGYLDAGVDKRALDALDAALEHASKRQVSAILAQARQLVARQPESGATHNLLGRALRKAGRFDDAIGELAAATRLTPGHAGYVRDLAGAYVARGLELLKRGKTTLAGVDIERARALDIDNPSLDEAEARIAADRGEQHLMAGRFGKALAELKQAADKAPQLDERFRRHVATLLARLGSAFKANNDDGSALTAFARALKVAPGLSIAQINVAELSYSEGQKALTDNRFDDAIAHFQRAREADPSEKIYRTALADAFDQRGFVFLGLGEIDAALHDFRAGIALDPTNSSLFGHLRQAEQALS